MSEEQEKAAQRNDLASSPSPAQPRKARQTPLSKQVAPLQAFKRRSAAVRGGVCRRLRHNTCPTSALHSLPPQPATPRTGMVWTSLDRDLVKEDVFAKVTLDKLDTLSPAQLAVATGRDDLDFLTRFRAGMDFLDRRSSFRAHCADQTSGTVPDPSGGEASEPTRCRGDHD